MCLRNIWRTINPTVIRNLVCEGVTTTRSRAVTLESYRLAGDGAMLVNVVRPDHSPLTLVFQRK